MNKTTYRQLKCSNTRRYSPLRNQVQLSRFLRQSQFLPRQASQIDLDKWTRPWNDAP